MSKCKQCGFELDADVRYCPNCATKVDTPAQPAAASDAFTAAKADSMSEKAAKMREEIRASLDTAIDASTRRIEKILSGIPGGKKSPSGPTVRSTSRGSTKIGLTMTCQACEGSGSCSSCSGEGKNCTSCSGTGECAECGGTGEVGQ
jgi:hypothetical protein